MTSCRTVRECCALLGARLCPNPIPSAVCGGRCHAARKEHATSRVEHRDPVFVVVCPAATAPPLSTERLRCGIMNPQAPVVCSGDVKQQRTQTIATTDHSEQQSMLSHCSLDVAGERVSRSATNAMLHAVLSYINSAFQVKRPFDHCTSILLRGT
jgi:hypothetical protein